jgi:hypothetical protein
MEVFGFTIYFYRGDAEKFFFSTVDLLNRGASQRRTRPGKPGIKAVKAVLI